MNSRLDLPKDVSAELLNGFAIITAINHQSANSFLECQNNLCRTKNIE
jgi:hypothetical protein